MDSVGLSGLKEIEKDRLKAEEQQVTTETVTATIKQRKRVSFTILGHNKKDIGSSNSVRRVKGFSRKCKKCNGVLMKEELRNNLNSNHEPIEQRGAKRPSNDLPHTCSRGSKNKHDKCDNDIDMERKKPVPMKELTGIMRVPPRFSSSSSLNNNNNNNNNDNIGAPQHAQHAQQQQPIVRFKYSKLVNALKRSNETRGLIEKIVKKIKTDFNSSSLMSSSSSSPASASASAPNNCTNNNDSEEESRRRCSVRRKVCAEFTKAMMAQTLPSTMISYVENNVMIFNSNNSNSNSKSNSNNNSNNNNHNNANAMMPSMMMMMNRRRRCATMGNGGRTRIVHRILIDQHKRILGDNNNERKDNTTTTKNPPTTGKKKMKEDDKY